MAIGSRTLAATLAVTLAVVLLAIIAFEASWQVKILAGGVACYLVLSLFLHPRHSLGRDPFAIHNLSRINLLLGFVFNCLYVATPAVRVEENLIMLSLVICLATVLVADVVVMLVPGVTRLPRGDLGRGNRAVVRFFIGLFLVGWVWRLFAFSQGMLQGTLIGTKLEVSGASNAIGLLTGLATIAMWGTIVFARRPLRYVPLVVLEIGWLLVTGSKAATLYILVPLMLILYWRDIMRIDARFVGGVLALLLLFLGSFVVVHSYRVAVARQILEGGYERLEPIAAINEIEISNDDYALVGRSLSERLNFAERFLLILSRDRQQPTTPWLGTSYMTALAWGIPRAIWPEKPPMSLGRYFATEYLGWGEESRSEAGITIWGEAYLNFRIVGVLIIPGVWIAALQVLYVLALRFGRWGLLFLASGFMLMVNSLSANIAMPLAALAQLGLQLVGFAVLISLARGTGRWLEVQLRV